MFNSLAQGGGGEFFAELIVWLLGIYAFFIANLFIFREIFNIPSMLRHQKEQIRLLESLVKSQRADTPAPKAIISESTASIATVVESPSWQGTRDFGE